MGFPLALSSPHAGNHNDLYAIEKSSEDLFLALGEAQISIDGLFVNADSCFDSKEFRSICNKWGLLRMLLSIIGMEKIKMSIY